MLLAMTTDAHSSDLIRFSEGVKQFTPDGGLNEAK